MGKKISCGMNIKFFTYRQQPGTKTFKYKQSSRPTAEFLYNKLVCTHLLPYSNVSLIPAHASIDFGG